MLDKKGRKIDSPLIGPFDEGSSLTLTCKSNGGKKFERSIPLIVQVYSNDNDNTLYGCVYGWTFYVIL